MGGSAAAFGEGEGPVEQKPYALFDFDGTLIRGDSIVRFLRYAHRRGLVSAGGLARAGLCAALYGLRLLTAEEAKQQSLAFLKGRGEKEVSALAEDFCREALVPALYPEGVRELRQRSAEGAEVLLISASPSFYLEPLKRMLPISAVIATRMDVEDGVYTGLLFGENCRGVQKPLRLAEYLAARGEMVDYAASWAYGDSAGDTPMLMLCGHKAAVNAKRRLVKRLRGADGVVFLRFEAPADRA